MNKVIYYKMPDILFYVLKHSCWFFCEIKKFDFHELNFNFSYAIVVLTSKKKQIEIVLNNLRDSFLLKKWRKKIGTNHIRQAIFHSHIFMCYECE